MFFTEKDTYSTGYVFKKSCSTAHLLEMFGVKKGSVVAFRITRSVEASIIFFALSFIGALIVLIDPHEKVRDAVKDTRVVPDFYLTNEETSADISYGGYFYIYKDDKKLSIDFSYPFTLYTSNVDINAPSVILFTSGSTGKRKAVTLSQYNYINHVSQYGPAGGSYSKTDVAIELLPLFHVFGLAVILTVVFYHYELFFPKQVDIPYVCECIDKYEISRVDGVPSLLMSIAEMKKKSH